MPKSTPWIYENIKIESDDDAYVNRTMRCLDVLDELEVGKMLFTSLELTQHPIIIQPTAPGGGNKCVASGAGVFARLRDALYDAGRGYVLKDELSATLKRADMGGMSRDMIASQLARGMSLVSLHTDQNVKQVVGTNPNAAGRFAGDSLEDRTKVARQLLDDLASGAKKYYSPPVNQSGVTRSWQFDLLRILKPWCEAGPGNGSRMHFDPSRETSCEFDKEGTRRPPAIGLAHEFCHAWRNAAGLRFYADNENDDEVMTTGFPPYLYEKISENMFRSQWKEAMLDMRTDYKTYKSIKLRAKDEERKRKAMAKA